MNRGGKKQHEDYALVRKCYADWVCTGDPSLLTNSMREMFHGFWCLSAPGTPWPFTVADGSAAERRHPVFVFTNLGHAMTRGARLVAEMSSQCVRMERVASAPPRRRLPWSISHSCPGTICLRTIDDDRVLLLAARRVVGRRVNWMVGSAVLFQTPLAGIPEARVPR